MIKLLFLCTGNSCRSQMAEGYARLPEENQVAVKSAGIVAHGKNPRASAIIKEDGIDISNQESTQLTEEMLQWVDWAITVCRHADGQYPALPPETQKKHWHRKRNYCQIPRGAKRGQKMHSGFIRHTYSLSSNPGSSR